MIVVDETLFDEICYRQEVLRGCAVGQSTSTPAVVKLVGDYLAPVVEKEAVLVESRGLW